MCFPLGAWAQETSGVKGIIFEDKNGNSKRDAGEKGIHGVAVSNGVEVVLSGGEGNYQLPLQKDNIVFVIKPADYSLPLNEYNMPRSYYLHKPLGSPALKYPGVDATAEVPASLDFGLRKEQPALQFSAFVFGDPQPYTLQEVAHFEKGIVEEARKAASDKIFGISLGDLVGDKLDLHLPYAKAVQQMQLPWYNVMGNHDMNYDATTDSLSDETFERNFGPANYAFNYGKAHFIVLDNILYPDPRDGKGYWGGFRPDQLTFVRNTLKYVPKDNLVVLCFHIPLWTEDGSEFNLQDRQQLFDLLKGYENVLALSAHTHLQRHNFYTKAEGWRNVQPLHEFNIGTTSGDWYSGALNDQGIPISTMRDGTPKGYGVLNVNQQNYSLAYKVAGQPETYQIRIYNPKLVLQGQRTSAAIYANFFLGSGHDDVLCRVDNGKWRAMQLVEMADPAYLKHLVEYDMAEQLPSGKRPSNPEPCTHLWKIDIPTKLAPGAHTIEVKATDMFGKTYTQSGSYTVVTTVP